LIDFPYVNATLDKLRDYVDVNLADFYAELLQIFQKKTRNISKVILQNNNYFVTEMRRAKY